MIIKVGDRFGFGFYANGFYEINSVKYKIGREIYCRELFDVNKYALLTDFINEHIDMKERLERLENNNKK